MDWHVNLYALILFACAFVTGPVAVSAWRHRAQVSAGPALTLLATAVWSVGYGIAIGVHDPFWRIFWAKAQHLGIALAPVALIVTAAHYAGRERWLSGRNLALLSAVPGVGMVLAWTNEWHGLIWQSTALRIVTLPVVGPLALLEITYGPYFWFYTLFNNAALLAAAWMFLQAARRARGLRRRQGTVLLAGTLLCGAAIALYLLGNLTGWSPLPGLDLAPIGYSLNGLVLAWALLRYRLFDVVPVARERLIEDMADAVFVLDEQGRIVDANAAMLEVLGRPAEEVVGRRAGQVLAGQADLVERYRHTPEARDEVRIGSGEGRRCFDLRISPLYGQRRQLLGRVVVLRDVTARWRAEEERERLIGELDAFAHTVAHDLKGPLSSVIGYAELVEGDAGDLPAAQRDRLRSIVWTGYKMANIVDELLLLASLRQEEVQVRPLDMGRIVADALRRVAFLRQDPRVQIEVAAEWPAALGHATWVEEVWVNYVSNAVQHGGRPLRVRVGADAPAGGRVRFWVRDDGVGIAPEAQAGLFAPFGRAVQVRARGHGLGLSIVRRIVERLRGEVGVESTPGQGSLFWFALPQAGENGPGGEAQ